MANRTMKDLWDYMGKMINTKTVYANGRWGQFDSQGRQQFDCVCAIKAYGWDVPLGVDITPNQYTYIANNKATVPDESIANIYAKATKKSTNMSSVPTDRPYLVYMDNAHIGVAYHGRVREMCGGSVMDARETDLKSQKWNKWSNLYWAEESIDTTTVPVVGYLDLASYNNNTFTCAGWAYANGGSQKVSIKIYKSNTIMHTFDVIANGTRTDVKSVMGYSTDKVGYVVSKTLTLANGTYTVKAYVGTTQLTNTKTFTVNNVVELTATSYPDYPTNSNQYYRIRKSFTDSKSSQGSYEKWAGAFNRWTMWKNEGYHVYDNNGKQLDGTTTTTTNSSTAQTTQTAQPVKAELTKASYPNYTGNKHYYVQKKFKSWLGSKGAFQSWANAFNEWSKNKNNGYHVYDNEGNQLD